MSEISYFKVELNAVAMNLEIEFESCNVHEGRWNVRVNQAEEERVIRWDAWDVPSLWDGVIQAIGKKISDVAWEMLPR